MGILYLLIGAAFGAIITYLQMQNNSPENKEELVLLKQQERALDQRIKSGEEKHQQLAEALASTREALDQQESEVNSLEADLSRVKAQLEITSQNDSQEDQVINTETPMADHSDEIATLKQELKRLSEKKSEIEIENSRLKLEREQSAKRISDLEKSTEDSTTQCDELNRLLTEEKTAHQASKEQLAVQRDSLQELGKRFNADFEHMAIEIMEGLASPSKEK